MTAYRNPEVFASSPDPVDVNGGPLGVTNSMLSMGGAQHKRYRALVQPSFLPANGKWWAQNWISDTVDVLVDGLAHDGRAELNVDFFAAIPLLTITGSFGVPVEQALEIRQAIGHDPQKVVDMVRPIVVARREEPQDDLISILVQAELTDEDGGMDRLTDREIDSFVLLLLGAGSGTTWKQMGTTLTALLQRPELLEAVRVDRQLLRPAIEEALRWMPTDPMFSRWVIGRHRAGRGRGARRVRRASRDRGRQSGPCAVGPPRRVRPHPKVEAVVVFRAGRAHLSRHARRSRRDDRRDLGAARPAAEPAARPRRRTAALRRHVRAWCNRDTRPLRPRLRGDHDRTEVHSSPISRSSAPITSAAYRETGGEVGYLWNGVPTLLLTVTGRRSGNEHTSALIFARDGDDYLVVASMGGAPMHPKWYLNLQANPTRDPGARRSELPVTARTAAPDEKPRLWQIVTDVWPNYDVYQITDRSGDPRRRAVTIVTSAEHSLRCQWVERAVERSAAVQRSRLRIAKQVRQMLDAARRLIAAKGDEFTTQELVHRGRCRAADVLPVLRQQGRTAAGGDRRRDDRRVRTLGLRPPANCPIRWPGCGTTSRRHWSGSTATASSAATARFVVSTRWRLHRHVPHGTRRGREAVRRSAARRGERGGRGRAAESARPGMGFVVYRRAGSFGVSLLRIRRARRRRAGRGQGAVVALLPDRPRRRHPREKGVVQ